MLDVFADTDNYMGMVIMLVIGIALALPLVKVARSDESLTWARAILLGTWLTTLALIFIADVPSRMLYWFDANANGVAEQVPLLAPLMSGTIQLLGMETEVYLVVRDVVVNTVQGIFFIAIVAAIYIWGERHRKTGRF